MPPTSGLAPVSVIKFDPCGLDASVVAELKLDASTKQTYNGGAPQGLETGCRWQNSATDSTVGLDVGRSTRTRQDYLTNTSFAVIARTTVGSHEAVEFSGSDPADTFSVAIGVSAGVVVVTANTNSSNKPGTTAPDAKTEVVRMATIIEPLLPS